MSLLIKGMEMPKDGETVTITICADGLVFEELKEPGDVFHAVPVPPHGDLIDKQYAYQNTMAMGEHMRKIILKQIDLLPTVIPAEEET